MADGCTRRDPLNCPELRGRVFQSNASSTWTARGLFELPLIAEASLGYTGNGDFGFDTVTLGLQGSGGPTLERQVIAGYATKQLYIGMLGITPRGVNFTEFNNPEPSILTSLKSQGKVASNSWAYTAGAYYTPKKTFGSLTFGGYDETRSVPNNLTFPFGVDISRDLIVGIQSIRSGFESLLPSGIIAYIDSTVSQIWLPTEACYLFERAFGLVWNSTAELYLVNETLHDTLVTRNASIQFTLGATVTGGETINITMPYASFDLTASYPLVGRNTTSRYFPLKRAANDTQYTLGRTFLQEAYATNPLNIPYRTMLNRHVTSYLTVDYDRSTFTLAQASHPDPSVPQRLVPILPPSNSSSNPSTTPSRSALGIGAIAGIAAGAFLLLLIILLACIGIRRRRSRDRKVAEASAADAPDTDPVKVLGWKAELDAQETTFLGHEVPAEGVKEFREETVVSPVYGRQEMDSKDRYRGDVRGDEKVYEMSADPVVGELHVEERRVELEGGDEGSRRLEGGGRDGVGDGVKRKAIRSGDAKGMRQE